MIRKHADIATDVFTELFEKPHNTAFEEINSKFSTLAYLPTVPMQGTLGIDIEFELFKLLVREPADREYRYVPVRILTLAWDF